VSELSDLVRSLDTRVKLHQRIDSEQIGILLMRIFGATEEDRQEALPRLLPLLKSIITPKIARKHKKILKEVVKLGSKYANGKRSAGGEGTPGVEDGEDVLEGKDR
jgi:hypothetical protein